MTPEQYNSTFGLNLALAILDEVQRLHALGHEATNGTISEAIAKRIGMGADARQSLHNRVRHQVRILELGGRIKRTEHRDRHQNIYYKRIEPCSEV